MVVFYRKYRPQLFSEVVGQEAVVNTLINSIKMGKIAHAYLFAGPRGTGKTTLARLLAKAINCVNTPINADGNADERGKNTNESTANIISENQRTNQRESAFLAEPCNQCSACREIAQGSAMDVVEIDAASNTGVDNIRDLVEGIKFAPARLKYKTYIIDEAHMLSKGAFNALLKTLEEPPEYAVFVLATTEVEKILPTILSRVQRFDFRRQSVPELVRKLKFVAKKEGVDVEEAALKIIAKSAQGAFRDAESLFERIASVRPVRDNLSGEATSHSAQISNGVKEKITKKDAEEILGTVDVNAVFEFIGMINNSDTSCAVTFLNDLWREGANLKEFIKSTVDCLRKVMILKINPDLRETVASDLTDDELNLVLTYAERMELDKIAKIINTLTDAEEKMKKSPIPILPLELAVVELAK